VPIPRAANTAHRPPRADHSAAQVGAVLGGDEGGKSFAAPLFGGAAQKGLEMALQDAVEDRVLRSVALIAWGRVGPRHSLGPGGGDAVASAGWSA